MDPSYNNSFGSFGTNSGRNSQFSLSGAGSDVILPGKTKKKKPLLYIIVVTVLFLAVLAVVVVFQVGAIIFLRVKPNWNLVCITFPHQ